MELKGEGGEVGGSNQTPTVAGGNGYFLRQHNSVLIMKPKRDRLSISDQLFPADEFFLLN